MIIDCEECALRRSSQCQDCFVMAVVSRDPGPLVLDPEEAEAIEALQEAGLAPALRFTPRQAQG